MNIKLMDWVNTIKRDEDAQGMIEYGLILALVSIMAVSALGVVGDKVDHAFDHVNQTLAVNFDQALADNYASDEGHDNGQAEIFSLLALTNDDGDKKKSHREGSENEASEKVNSFREVMLINNPYNNIFWVASGLIIAGFLWKLFF